jgi:plasmid stability protein
MAQILIRGLDDRVVKRLGRRAQQKGRALQAEVKGILENATKLDMASARALAERIRRKLKDRPFSDNTELIREDRDR